MAEQLGFWDCDLFFLLGMYEWRSSYTHPWANWEAEALVREFDRLAAIVAPDYYPF
jgi:hypothetical protein